MANKEDILVKVKERLLEIFAQQKLFEKFKSSLDISNEEFIKYAKELGVLVASNDNYLYVYGIDESVVREHKNNEEKYNHPSFGTISLSRMSTPGTKLFGSAIQHENIISLKINEAEMINTELFDTKYFSKDKIIEVYLSNSQFAELITTLNYGSGVPCTIDFKELTGRIIYREPDSLKPIEDLNKMQKISEKDKDNTINNIQKKLSDILNKNNIGKKDREDIKDMFNQLSNYTNQKFEFMQSQFQKKMEKHIAEAKSEIDSTLTNIALNKNNNKKKLEE